MHLDTKIDNRLKKDQVMQICLCCGFLSLASVNKDIYHNLGQIWKHQDVDYKHVYEFSKIFCCTRTVGCQKFVLYIIRMLYPGRFFSLVGHSMSSWRTYIRVNHNNFLVKVLLTYRNLELLQILRA